MKENANISKGTRIGGTLGRKFRYAYEWCSECRINLHVDVMFSKAFILLGYATYSNFKSERFEYVDD